ncbi:hypothetical protein [Paenibacillus sp. Soil724D2]|uniref:hypothetical protein n=1 Tax=Paenibacillus sp. (strain Soil724D2) TaxID=1736392 RepID=UPI0007139A07|nr:hypothetical protein [Paenibacillus sp. Soil724D2]KRE50622.1 hypothetical protein ASG85_20425 [Paenibacillus sp. Soil724D2]
MDIFGYGEDALTFWAIKNRMSDILFKLNDSTPSDECKVFYRPSFGRSGGEDRAGFGEFDSIIMSRERIFLIESKWKITNLELRPEQLNRHKFLRHYIDEWYKDFYTDWDSFLKVASGNLSNRGIKKPLAPAGSILASNLETLLRFIRKLYNNCPDIVDVLLYFSSANAKGIPLMTNTDFQLVPLEYTNECFGHYLVLEGGDLIN